MATKKNGTAKAKEQAGRTQSATRAQAASAKQATEGAGKSARQATQQATQRATQSNDQATGQSHMPEQASIAGRGMAQNAARAGSETMKAAERGTQQAVEMGRRQSDQLQSLVAESAKVYQDVADDSKDDVEAIMQTGARLAKGLQEMSWEMMNYTQQSLRMGLRAANDIMECRTVEDLVAVHRGLVKETVDVFLDESARLLKLSSRVTTDAVSPISERVSSGERQQRRSGNQRSQAQQQRESGPQFREQSSAGGREMRH